jgi:hypothetical protein
MGGGTGVVVIGGGRSVVVLVLASCEWLPTFHVMVSKVGWEEVGWGTYCCHNITTMTNNEMSLFIVWWPRRWQRRGTLHSVASTWQALIPGDVAFLRCWGCEVKRAVAAVRDGEHCCRLWQLESIA